MNSKSPSRLAASCAAVLFLAATAQAAPIIDIYLLASTTSTGTYSSIISGVSLNEVLYYEVAFKFINNGTAAAPVYPTNTNMPTQITNMSASDFTGGQSVAQAPSDLGHSGLVSAQYSILQAAGNQIATQFTTISHGGSSNTLTAANASFNKFNGPGAAGYSANTNVGPFDYPNGAAQNMPDNSAYVYDGSSPPGSLQANGDRTLIGVVGSIGVTTTGTIGFTAANTPVLTPLNVGTFKITALGTGTASTINLAAAGATALTFRYNGNYNDNTDAGSIFTNYSLSTSNQNGPNPIIAYHPLVISNLPEPSSIVLFGLGLFGLIAYARRSKPFATA